MKGYKVRRAIIIGALCTAVIVPSFIQLVNAQPILKNTVIDKELNHDSPSIMKGRFETKGNYEIKDDKVVFKFSLMSHHTKPKQIVFGSGQQFEVIITNDDGEEVYRFSDGMDFTLALIYKTLNAGESIEWQNEWDMTNKEGEKLTSGKYKAEISILAGTEKKDERIEESELATIISFNLDILSKEEMKQASELPKNSDKLTENNIKEYEEIALDKEGIIKPEIAKQLIKEAANDIINALSTKDAEAISEFSHPVKGVRFTPYTCVSLESDVVFNKEEIKNFFKDQAIHLWGHYDGSGNEIKLTPSEYYEKFIYSEDFVNAEKVGYNEVLSSGNMLENQFEVYENPIVVEYYFSGFNPDYAGIDWRSLRLVFEEYEGSWKLVGIINNQWTI